MTNIFKQPYISISFGLSILLFIGFGYADLHGGETALEQATFYVY